MANEKNKIDIEKLLAEARRVQQPTANSGPPKTKSLADSVADAAKSAADAAKATAAVTETITWAGTWAGRKLLWAKRQWNTFMENTAPVRRVLGKVLFPLAWVVKNLLIKPWMYLWKKSDPKARQNKFSKFVAKAGRGFLLLWAAAAFLQPTRAVPEAWGGKLFGAAADATTYPTFEPVYDGARMAVSYRKETLYLSHTSEIDPEHNIHTVKGCRTATTCSEDEAVYFRVKPSLMHHFWSVAVNHDVFIPDEAVTPITPGLNKCEVTSYGFRWFAFRWLQAYPFMLDAKCTPLTIKQPFDNATAPAVTPPPAANAPASAPTQPATKAPGAGS